MFYLKLAWTNLKADRRVFVPFILASAFLMAVNVVMLNAYAGAPLLFKHFGADTAGYLFQYGAWVIFIMTVILAIYANGFLLKQRTRQLAVYNLIGFGRRQLAQMLVCEQLLCLLLAVVLGSVFGVGFARLGFLSLQKLLNVTLAGHFGLSLWALGVAACELIAVFTLLSLRDCCWLLRHKPLAMLREAKAGERDPKDRWLLLIVGIITLGVGYGMALTIKNPVLALMSFFIAVVLVIIGTFALFMAGSVFILKRLRKSEHFYYQPRHFINVSNMLYRMKQNGAGLAAICLLITMTMLTVGTTSTLFVGADQLVANEVASDVDLHFDRLSPKLKQTLRREVRQTAAATKQTAKLQISEAEIYPDTLKLSSKGVRVLTDKERQSNLGTAAAGSDARSVFVYTAAQYRALGGGELHLNSGQMQVYDQGQTTLPARFKLPESTFEVKQLQTWPQPLSQAVPKSLMLVVKDQRVAASLLKKTDVQLAKAITVTIGLNGSDAQQRQFVKQLRRKLPIKQEGIYLNSRVEAKASLMKYLGSFLFIGVLLGLTFILATALILYYKQISEGLADADRYAVLQRVGMSRQEVKSTINSQLLMLFYLPLVVAGVHAAAATNFIQRIFSGFGLVDGRLYVSIIVGTFCVFGIVYVLLYQATSRVYYRIVTRKAQ